MKTWEKATLDVLQLLFTLRPRAARPTGEAGGSGHMGDRR